MLANIEQKKPFMVLPNQANKKQTRTLSYQTRTFERGTVYSGEILMAHPDDISWIKGNNYKRFA